MPSFWRSAQRREVLSGVAVGLLGWMALGLAFLVPLFHYTSSQTVCVEGCVTTTIQGTDNLADLELPSWAWTLFVELLSLCLLCVLVSTVLHHRTGAEG